MPTAEFNAETTSGRTEYRDGRSLSADALTGDALARDAALHASQRAAHLPGIVGGLWLEVHKEKNDGRPERMERYSVGAAPGAAIDGRGRMLLWRDEVKASLEDAGEGPLGVWLRHHETVFATGTTTEMSRCDHTPELIVAALNDSAAARRAAADAVFLGSLHPAPAGAPWGTDNAGRNYIGAAGARIESPSRRTRLLLGPDHPGDPRRFAVGVRGGDIRSGDNQHDAVDVLTWETTGSVAIRTAALIETRLVPESELVTRELPAPARLVIGAASVALTTHDVIDPCRAWRMQPNGAIAKANRLWKKLLSTSRKAASHEPKCPNRRALHVVRAFNGLLRAIADDALEEQRGLVATGSTLDLRRLCRMRLIASLLRDQLIKRIAQRYCGRGGLNDNTPMKSWPIWRLVSDVVLCRLIIDELFDGQIRPLDRLPVAGLWFKDAGDADAEPPPGAMRLVAFEEEGRPVRELRITIPDPGEKNHPQRYRCSIGGATQPPLLAPDNPIRQTAPPYGIFSVLADHSVEIMGNLNVFAGQGTIMPGLVLQLAPPQESAAGEGAPPPILYGAMAWENPRLTRKPASDAAPEMIALQGHLRNLTTSDIASLTLFLTVYAESAADPKPKQSTFKTEKLLPASKSIDATTLFGPIELSTSDFGGVAIVVDALLLGATANNAVVQAQAQFIKPPGD